MRKLIIFALVMLALSGICNGQGVTNFGATVPNNFSKTGGKMWWTAYAGLDTVVLIANDSGVVKAVPIAVFRTLIDSGTFVHYSDTAAMLAPYLREYDPSATMTVGGIENLGGMDVNGTIKYDGVSQEDGNIVTINNSTNILNRSAISTNEIATFDTLNSYMPVYNIVDYGADTSIDNTAAIQRTILAACGWERVGYDSINDHDSIRQISLYTAAKVFTPLGSWRVSGRLIKKVVAITLTNEVAIKDVNTQLYIPYSPGVQHISEINPLSLTLEWESVPMPGLATTTGSRNHNNWKSGAQWKSTISTDSTSFPFVLSVVEGDPAFTCCKGSITYVTLKSPWITTHFDSLNGGTQLGGADLHQAINCWVYDPRIDVDAEGYSFGNYNHLYPNIGLWLTTPGQGATVGLERGWIGGYKYGAYAGEHTVIDKTQFTLNQVGLAVHPTIATHPLYLRNVAFINNQIGLMGDAPLPRVPDQLPYMPIEGTVTFERPCSFALFDLKDTANHFKGDLAYNIQPAGSGSGCTGANSNIVLRSGGDLLNYRNTYSGSVDLNTSDSLEFNTNLSNGLIRLNTLKLAYGTASFAAAIDFHIQKTTNGNMGIRVENKSNGASATAVYQAMNDAGNLLVVAKLGSGFTPFGILNPSDASIRNTSGGNLVFTNANAPGSIDFGAGGGATLHMRVSGAGNLGIGQSTPTAVLHLKAGTSTASTAPLKFASGTNLATPEAGAMEYDGTNYFVSNSVRYTLAKTLTNTGTLDFGNTAAQTSADLTITVTGAAVGDIVTLGIPAADANSSYTAYVSSTNTVTVRFNNYSSGSIDPASGTFRVSVLKY